MGKILQALKEGDFNLCPPAGLEIQETLDEQHDHASRRPAFTPFESPKPDEDYISVPMGMGRDRGVHLFRYFMDGSMRTTNAGYIVDNQHRFLPMFMAQIGVAAVRAKDGQPHLEEHRAKSIFLMPDTLSDEDTNEAKKIVKQAAASSKRPLNVGFECYEFDDGTTEPIDSARKKIISAMHDMELDQIRRLTKSGKVNRENMLAIDGSLQFYRNLERDQEAFRNVVGVAKSFNLQQRVGSRRKPMQVGALIAQLPADHRTPVQKVRVERFGLTVGAWYLRLRSVTNVGGLSFHDGVVKLELFPEDALAEKSQAINSARCNKISQSILNFRHPATPRNDSRWASHLYPIHLAERFIKSRFLSEHAIGAYL